jgi:hypothetical protein
MAANPEQLQAFLGKAVGDFGAAISAVLILIGDELSLYRELAKGRLTPVELAQRTDTNKRYVREWLGNQAAGGYVDYDAKSGCDFLNEEQALCLTDPKGPVDLPGAYMGADGAAAHDAHRIATLEQQRFYQLHASP